MTSSIINFVNSALNSVDIYKAVENLNQLEKAETGTKKLRTETEKLREKFEKIKIKIAHFDIK